MAGNLKKRKDWTRNLSKHRWWHRHFFWEGGCLPFSILTLSFGLVFRMLYKYRHNEDSLVERFVRGLMSFSLLHQNGGQKDQRGVCHHNRIPLVGCSSSSFNNSRSRHKGKVIQPGESQPLHVTRSFVRQYTKQYINQIDVAVVPDQAQYSVCLPRVRDPH